MMPRQEARSNSAVTRTKLLNFMLVREAEGGTCDEAAAASGLAPRTFRYHRQQYTPIYQQAEADFEAIFDRYMISAARHRLMRILGSGLDQAAAKLILAALPNLARRHEIKLGPAVGFDHLSDEQLAHIASGQKAPEATESGPALETAGESASVLETAAPPEQVLSADLANEFEQERERIVQMLEVAAEIDEAEAIPGLLTEPGGTTEIQRDASVSASRPVEEAMGGQAQAEPDRAAKTDEDGLTDPSEVPRDPRRSWFWPGGFKPLRQD